MDILLQYFCIKLIQYEIEEGLKEGDEQDITVIRMNKTKEYLQRKEVEYAERLEALLEKPIVEIVDSMQDYLKVYNVSYNEQDEIYYLVPKFLDVKEEPYQVIFGRFNSIQEAYSCMKQKKRRNIFKRT